MLKQIQRLPFAPIVALMFAVVAAVLVLATPIWLLEHAVVQLGLPEIVSQAAPPLGTKARFLLVMIAASGAGIGAFLVALPFRDPKPRKAQTVTVQPLRRETYRPHEGRPVEEAVAFNRPSVFTPPPLDDEPNLPSFLAQPLAEMRDESVPAALEETFSEEDELVLDALMIVEDIEAVGVLPVESEEFFVAAVRDVVEDVPVLQTDLPQMPEIFIQPETVLHLEPAPVPPPVDPVVEPVVEAAALFEERRGVPRLVEHREPTIAELMERFQRGLEALKKSDAGPFDDVTLGDALTRLERIAVGGR